MLIVVIFILVGGGFFMFKNGFIMKNINVIILLFFLIFVLVFVGVYVENREVYNFVFDQGEVMLCVGYNFDMGVGIMLINIYIF